MKILLHICCGPCALYCVKSLREKGNEVEGLFYNPNIHPVSEYMARRDALKVAAEAVNLDVHYHRELQFEDFFRKVALHEDSSRCPLCWELRLKQTAEFAQRNDFEAFTTTLLISPYQDQKKINEMGSELAEKYSVKFLSENFRRGFNESHKMSKEMGLYHQKYCGCVYSERERQARLKS
ncbi:MAG TPA: epoxyqueuosine reductase QueH [Candidatus Omnitrophica bacterium]|nr:epoxyqueuosine reductase QueH [Candidatus Omnitrophota bacterium]